MNNKVICMLMVLVMLFSSIDVTVFAGAEQIVDNEESDIFNNHRYQYFEGGISWYNAKVKCEELGGHLLVISSSEEQEYINSYVEELRLAGKLTKQNIWLGATISDGILSWVADEGTNYTNWASGEPNNVFGMQDCVMMYTSLSVNGSSGYWNDENGNGRNWEGYTLNDTGYICEWPEETNNEEDDSENIENTEYVSFEEHKYQYFNDGMSWYDALAKCEEMGGHLLVISSSEEQEFINSYVKDLYEAGNMTKWNIWLGASIKNGVLCWVTDEGGNYTNWNPGEPNNMHSIEDCIMMYTQVAYDGELGYWNDESGNGRNDGGGYTLDKFGYICEWSSEENATSGTLGHDNGFKWSYDEDTKTLTVTGEDIGLKGDTCSPFYSICSDVVNIVFQDCKLKGSAVNLFKDLAYVEDIQFNNCDTSEVTEMSGMFSGCSSLKVLNLSTFDMTSLLSVQGMLEGCDGLETIYTPKAMLDGVYISLPHTFYDSEKNSVTSIAKNLCNSIIVKKWTNNTGFNTQRDGWCFVNHSIGFDYDENYRIPKERYEKVFGSRYVATATTNKKTYNSMMPEWDGNCYGMSATAILFYLDILDWSKYDDLYENDFSYVNSYFYTLRDLDGIGAYACSDYKTEITELIECYQIFQQGSDNFGYASEKGSTFNNMDEFWFSMEEGKYEHNTKGNYISTVYDRILNSEEPLVVGIQGEQGGHAMVIRTDKEPLYVGDGWYRVYVYDPNKPYISEEIVENRELAKFYINNNSEDVYIELNKDENKWRYYGATSAGLSNKYWGCDEQGNVKKYMNNTRPEIMYVFSISDDNYPTEFTGRDGDILWEERNKDSVSIAMTDKSSFVLYSLGGIKLLEIEEGSPIMLADGIEYYPHIGYVEGEDSFGGGKLILPYTEFDIEYISGDDISIIGNDSVINIACDGASDISIGMEENSVDISSKEKNKIITQITDLGSENLYTSVVVDGVLDSSDTIALSLVEDRCVVAGDISGDSLLELYTDNETDTEEKLLMTLSEREDDVEILDVRNNVTEILDKDAPIISGISEGEVYYGDVIFTVKDAYLDKVYVDDNVINLIDGTYRIFADNKKHTIKAIDKSGNEVQYTITVNCEEIDYTVNGYNGIYDGQSHGIIVNVEESENIKVTYSTDGETFSEINPQFTDKGKYVVYYRIEGNTYNTVEGQEQVSIQGKDITVTAKDQYITYGDNIDKKMYTVTGLLEGDGIKECTLTSSTIEVTENGTIEVSGAKIVNVDNKDVTENYNISYKTGKLIIKDKISTEYEILEGEKSTWNGESSGLTIRGSGDFDKFVGVKVDDILISEEYYDVKSGSTIVTLKGSYLEELSVGIHTVEIVWTDGSVKTTFTVLEEINIPTINFTAHGYNGIYDGQAHSITVNVKEPADVKVTYSTDGEIFTESNPQFTGKGNHIVYYKIERESYTTVEGQEQVNIQGKDITITARDQYITDRDDIDKTMYTVSGLVEGDTVKEITLTSSTTEMTQNGSIEVSGVKIVNADDKDVTENYNISYKVGNLTIKEKLSTEYEILGGEKSTWNGDSEGLTIRGSGEFTKFIGVKVNGIFLSEEYYVAKSGSTIITIRDSYLETLDAGVHTIEIVWTDGSAETTFIVLENDEEITPPDTKDEVISPKTEDNVLAMLWITLIMIGMVIISIGLSEKQKLKK